MNPLSKLLSQFVQYRSRKASKDEIATQLGMSRRSLYNACQADKNLMRFTLGTLLKITSLFPMTVLISRYNKRRFFDGIRFKMMVHSKKVRLRS